MRNSSTDLNNILFAQLEKLADEELSQEDLDREVKRAKSMTDVASQILEAQKVTLDVIKLAEKQGIKMEELKAGKLFLNPQN